MARKQKQTVKVNYVEFDKAYCHVLEPKLNRICAYSFSSKTTTAMMKNYVANLVKDARKTEKYGEFITNLYALEDKKSIYLYCRNSVRKAEHTVVEVKQ